MDHQEQPAEYKVPEPAAKAPAPATPEPAPAAPPEPEDMSEEAQQKKAADAEKELGNEAYKKKKFEQALQHYGKAMELYDQVTAHSNWHTRHILCVYECINIA